MNFKFLLIYLTVFCISTAFTQVTDDWKISGQIQLRTELDGRDFSNDTYPLTFTTLRTKVGVERNISDQMGFFVQFRDSRIFGQEPNTLASINGVDLHQGYVLLNKPFGFPLKLQAGRFEMVYGTERFFGAVGWHYVGRSFDGARLSFQVYNNIKFDLFAITLSNPISYISNAVPSAYQYPPVADKSVSLYGFWKTVDLNKEHRVDGFGYYEVNRTNNAAGDNQLEQFTVGLNHAGKYGPLSSMLEYAYQFGTTADIDIAAYLASLQLFYSAGISKFGVGADILSGTKSTSEKINSFRPSYGTNHKFYGYMDYFINIPENTRGLGLNDIYASASIQPEGSKFSGSLFVHHFMTNVEPADNSESVFGQEVDLTIRYEFIKGTAITWGGSVFFPGDQMKSIFKANAEREDLSDPGFWSYIMITANF